MLSEGSPMLLAPCNEIHSDMSYTTLICKKEMPMDATFSRVLRFSIGMIHLLNKLNLVAIPVLNVLSRFERQCKNKIAQ